MTSNNFFCKNHHNFPTDEISKRKKKNSHVQKVILSPKVWFLSSSYHLLWQPKYFYRYLYFYNHQTMTESNPKILDSILDQIGNTPLVKLNKIPQSLGIKAQFRMYLLIMIFKKLYFLFFIFRINSNSFFIYFFLV